MLEIFAWGMILGSIAPIAMEFSCYFIFLEKRVFPVGRESARRAFIGHMLPPVAIPLIGAFALISPGQYLPVILVILQGGATVIVMIVVVRDAMKAWKLDHPELEQQEQA